MSLPVGRLGPSQSDDRRLPCPINMSPLCAGGFSKTCASRVCSRRRRPCTCGRCETVQEGPRLPPEKGTGSATFNNRLSVLGFFFSVTCAREEMKRHMRYQRLAKKIPVVLSAEEVTRILEVAPGPGL